jgi:eukaryotic-like serine/threonine-protein kinase
MTSVTPPPVYNGRYELTRQIARGGMAEVYLARDLLLDRPVALKVLFPELSVDPNFVERFRREAQAAANLSHPNIVSVFDWGQADSTYFIVMEYIDGRSLSSLLRAETRLAPDEAAMLGADVASALAFAHSRGVIHRDVKPGNILMTADGQVKVTDFGIARAANNVGDLTQTGAVMGTATYFSPEQAQGYPVDARSDVYALGVVLYEAVAGRPPFVGDNPISVAYQHVRESPTPLRQLDATIPVPFETIVSTAMAKAPESRYQTVQELRADLLRFHEGKPILAGGVGTTIVQPRADQATQVVPGVDGEEKDKRTARYVIVLLVLLAILGVVVYFVGKDLGFWGSSSSSFTVPNVLGKTTAQANQTLAGDGLKVSVSRQANQATTDTVFAQSPAPPKKVNRGDTVTIDVSTGPVSTTVPNVSVPFVVGENVNTATANLRADGFAVSTQQVSSNQSAGTVVSQSPHGGTSAPRGSTVTLSVAAGFSQVRVPSLVGLTRSQATDALNAQGLQLGNVSNVSSSTVPSGQVISSNPASGTLVPANSSVSLVISTGPAQVQVPNVTGFSQSGATAQLGSSGLNVGNVSCTMQGNQNTTVFSTSPSAGTSVNSGSSVNLTLTKPNCP